MITDALRVYWDIAAVCHINKTSIMETCYTPAWDGRGGFSLSMKLPNVLIIGVQKAGTTSLFNYISQHPEVYGPEAMKDFPFFSKDDYYGRGHEWFSKFFKRHNGKRVILHGHVNYIYHYELSAPRIYQFDKNIKMILILRNPAERAYSAYWQARKIGVENKKSFEEAIAAEQDRKKGNYRERSSLTYIDHGYYCKQIKYFLKFFDSRQILINLFDNLIEDKKAVMKQAFKFIEVDDSFSPSFGIQNPSGIPRIEMLQRFLERKVPVPERLKDFIPLDRRIMLKESLRKLNTRRAKYPPISETTRKELIKLYEKEIIELQELIDKDLSRWLIT
jgi:hypothetical protein